MPFTLTQEIHCLTSPSSPLRLAILASGRGSNLQAILDAIATDRLHAEVVGVFSDRPDAPALTKVLPRHRWSADPHDSPDRISFDTTLSAAIAAVTPLGRMRRLHAHPQRSIYRTLPQANP